MLPERAALRCATAEGGVAVVKKVVSGLAILFVLVYIFTAPEDAGRALRDGFDNVVTFLTSIVPSSSS